MLTPIALLPTPPAELEQKVTLLPRITVGKERPISAGNASAPPDLPAGMSGALDSAEKEELAEFSCPPPPLEKLICALLCKKGSFMNACAPL